MWNLMEYPETSKYAQVGYMGNVFVGNARVCAGAEIERIFRFSRQLECVYSELEKLRNLVGARIGKETGRG